MALAIANFITRIRFTRCGDYLSKAKYVTVKDKNDRESTFDAVQGARRDEALRSILFVHTTSKDNLLGFCQNYGKIETAHFYKKLEKQYALIEFTHGASVDKLMAKAKHFPNTKRIPLDSRCLFFTQGQSRRNLRPNLRQLQRFDVNNFGQLDLNDSYLMKCQSVDSQMKLLHEKQSLSDLDIRLRYFIAAEIETLSRKLFPDSVSSLFGSSVTGLGRHDGDVDVNLCIEPFDRRPDASMQHTTAYFISKIRPEVDRSFNQQLLESYGSLMRHFVPQMVNVKWILRARVPIVKFKHSSTDIDGDLCIGNKEAIEMSRHLYRLLHGHDCILPLVFTVRQWARCNGVTKSNPGPWLSNFMLTLLIVFYLQKHPTIVLPAIKDLSRDVKDDKEITVNKGELLLGFFKFYAQLDFSTSGISVYQGDFVAKPRLEVTDDCEVSDTLGNPLQLENPVERHLNAGKNVMEANLLHFQKLCVQADDILSSSLKPNLESPWGILKILSIDDTKTDDENDVATYENFPDVTTVDKNKMTTS